MDKYIISIETIDGFSGQDYNKTFDSIEQFKSWLISAEFEDYAAEMNLCEVKLQNAITLETILSYTVEVEYGTN